VTNNREGRGRLLCGLSRLRAGGSICNGGRVRRLRQRRVVCHERPDLPQLPRPLKGFARALYPRSRGQPKCSTRSSDAAFWLKPAVPGDRGSRPQVMLPAPSCSHGPTGWSARSRSTAFRAHSALARPKGDPLPISQVCSSLTPDAHADIRFRTRRSVAGHRTPSVDPMPGQPAPHRVD
jgi:hypothetical protein